MGLILPLYLKCKTLNVFMYNYFHVTKICKFPVLPLAPTRSPLSHTVLRRPLAPLRPLLSLPVDPHRRLHLRNRSPLPPCTPPLRVVSRPSNPPRTRQRFEVKGYIFLRWRRAAGYGGAGSACSGAEPPCASAGFAPIFCRRDAVPRQSLAPVARADAQDAEDTQGAGGRQGQGPLSSLDTVDSTSSHIKSSPCSGGDRSSILLRSRSHRCRHRRSGAAPAPPPAGSTVDLAVSRVPRLQVRPPQVGQSAASITRARPLAARSCKLMADAPEQRSGAADASLSSHRGSMGPAPPRHGTTAPCVRGTMPCAAGGPGREHDGTWARTFARCC